MHCLQKIGERKFAMSPLVSIMTPCYNGEKFVERYLDTVLSQTYDNIEVIIVDDGSTDKTAEIIKSYIPKFESKGYKLIYVYQENSGAASAINTAMPLVTGDFITWLDSDDFYTPDSIEKRVNFLQQNPQYDFCICQMYEVNENDLKKIVRIRRRVVPPAERDNFFIDLLKEYNVFFPNIYLAKRESFFKVHPTKKIYPSRQGQNWQLLLPLAYSCKYGYINEPLCFYVVRKDSHFHSPRTLRQEVERNLEFIELLNYTIKQLNTPNEKELLNFIWAKFMHKNLILGINYGSSKLINDCCRKANEKKLDIFGVDNFDIKLLLEKYIFPKFELQYQLNEVKEDISKITEKLMIW